ncbi:hypothetical protein HMI56_000284 [Coelomomyces lativittatus]|nr:hypothetical protein HMI56_000284 [Coelomomyces lativittatus]
MQNHLRIEMTIDEMLYKCRMREWTSKNALQSAKRLAMQHANAHEGKVALKPRIKSTGQLRNLVSPNGQHPYTSQSVFYQKPKYSFTEKLVSASLGDLSVIKRVNELKSGSILPSNSNDKEMEMEKEKEKEKEKDRNGFSRRRSLSERYLEKEETDDLMFRVEGIPDASLPLTDKPPIMLPSSENPSLLLSTSPSLLISNPTTPPETPMLSHPSTPYNVIFE